VAALVHGNSLFLTVTTQQAFTLALQHHQAGRLADAETLYRQILTVEPNHADVLHHLGIIAHQAGRHDLALELIRKSIILQPHNPAAHFNLGEAYRTMGRFDEAVASYRRALGLKPDYLEAHLNLGVALRKRDQYDEAIASYRRALELKPDYFEAHLNLGNTLRGKRQFDEAIAAYRRALQLKPDHPDACNNLGNALWENGQLDEAIAAYRRALQLKPDHSDAGNNLGNALKEQGQFDEAIASFRRAVQLQPDQPEIHHNLGNAFREKGQLAEAVTAYRRALEIKPDYPEAHNNRGVALTRLGQLDEAVAAFRHALELKPHYAEAHNNLGGALVDKGRLDEAIAEFRKVVELHPDRAWAHSNLIYTLHFHPGHDDGTIAGEQQRWARQFGEPLQRLIVPHTNDRDPERRLRIGYVSPNFHRHPICYFLTPLLEAHDKAGVEIYCYSSVKRSDEFTERVKKSANVWRDVFSLGDHALAQRIRADQIDILVDLTQHMANNRLLMFARKPAPIQIAWLGYPASTGLPAMDYRFTDVFMEPKGSLWSESVETPIRLPNSWFCFDPIEHPEPAALPALRAGQVTFGSLNNFCKVNEAVLRLWVAILQAVEGSRLLLHCPAGTTQTRLRQWFEAQGIAGHRLELIPRTATRAEYLELFQRIDIGLDPFPYNGGTTTCEALCMGVPVVSLAGRTAVSRLGLSVLTTAGLPELVAHSEEDYVRIAAELAGDLPRLAELRRTLRPRMQASPLMDAPRFARNIEAAYRTMWQRWCTENQSSHV